MFKHLNLQHWSSFAKLTLTLVIIVMPICFILIASFSAAIILVYNRLAVYFYDRKIQKLEDREKELVNELTSLNGKK